VGKMKLFTKLLILSTGEVGWVRYTVYVKIDGYQSSDTESKAMFTVLPKADLNVDPEAKVWKT